ncbi:nucleotidyltransferase substrate binding protein [Methylomonas sp. MED-D]|uniref:nucleotidyltransferase substrate binding protein n=1 Tax=unclassified Methylomonas TaxID=2608980 RepID=UPI0028A2EAD8|nr:nucleotidyltransferase substrate binding protein [Methylomonas sp. MV1]MDT4331598.1 nucleotidyltransferase substrate binding protein [Methylomonas sp. MV1]
MAELNTDYFARCIATLERAQGYLSERTDDEAMYDIYRAACVKEFEIILEQSGRLLKKCLKPYFASPKQVDALTFKDVFRHAAKHGLISVEAVERWLQYRDNRNDTAHDYGEGFAEETLNLLPQFIFDAKQLNDVIAKRA